MTSNTPWTPGPWAFEPHNGYGGTDPNGDPWPFGYVSTQTPMPIFELTPFLEYEPSELAANARLISKAPETVELLERFISPWRVVTDQDLREIIGEVGGDCVEQRVLEARAILSYIKGEGA